MKKKDTKNNTNFSTVLVLTIVFIVLRLTNVIDWSWIWVFSPIWIELLIVALIFVITLLILSIKKAIKKAKKTTEFH